MYYWRKDSQINQQNQIESPDIDPHIYSQMIF